jgi:type III secretion protein D
MKILRVLTGVHAGVQVRLNDGQHYVVGAGDEADICISDWHGANLLLAVDETGLVRATHGGADDGDGDGGPSGLGVPVLIPDLVAVKFDDTVLCVGPTEMAWPTDVDLLAPLWTPKASAKPQGAKTRRLTLIVGVATAAGLMGVVSVAAMLPGSRLVPAPSAASPANLPMYAGKLDTMLHAAGLTELHAATEGQAVVVKGIVRNDTDDALAKALIGRADGSTVMRRYDVATVDAQNIQDSLATPSVKVEYSGQGAFTVMGAVPSPAKVRQAVEGLRPEFGANVKRIDVAVTQAPPPQQPVAYSGLIESAGIRYFVSPDGTKHMIDGHDAMH